MTKYFYHAQVELISTFRIERGAGEVDTTSVSKWDGELQHGNQKSGWGPPLVLTKSRHVILQRPIVRYLLTHTLLLYYWIQNGESDRDTGGHKTAQFMESKLRGFPFVN